MNSSEIWLPVVGYESHYEVSNKGRVRRIMPAQGARVGQIIKQHEMKTRGGYMSVGMCRVGTPRTRFRVHRLVADAFLGPSDLPLVRHLDGNPKNNSVENLRHGTVSDNAYDRVAHGTQYRGNQNSGKTHCKRGHEFTPANTIPRRNWNGNPGRRCRACYNAAARLKNKQKNK